jgi:hypothetical protein
VAKVRVDGIFACPASYEQDSYLAYCQARGYGDYDHGGIWFGMEPSVTRAATKADVLFLGSSRMEFAFSSEATRQWFGRAGSSYYLLGFSHTENVSFIGRLIERLKPTARVFVVNVDRIFDDRQTEPAKVLFEDKAALDRYVDKQRWQSVHRTLCSRMPALCGSHSAFYRYRPDGHWYLSGREAEFTPGPVADGKFDPEPKWSTYEKLADTFLTTLTPNRKCVILTIIPSGETRRSEAQAISRSVGIELISPQVDGLTTFDGSHLDPASAERWSTAFFSAAGERIAHCLQSSNLASRGR